MDILIIENEAPVASKMQEMACDILGERVGAIKTEPVLDKGIQVFKDEHPDLLFLDLNLEEQSCFQKLEEVTAESGLTILFSDQEQKAAEAVQYGILDVVPKHFTRDHMVRALDCFLHPAPPEPDGHAAFLSVYTEHGIRRVPNHAVRYIARKGKGAEIELETGEKLLHHKSLDQLMMILPQDFERVHKSMIVSLKSIVNLSTSGTKCLVELRNGMVLPIGRRRQRNLRLRLEASKLSLQP